MNFRYRKNNYNTPANYPNFFFDKLSLSTRAFFYCRILKLIYDTNRVIRKEKFSDKAWSEASYYALRSVEGCGGKVHIINMDNIDKYKGSVVFIGNHMSMLETFLLPGIICPRKTISFVIKHSLINYPLFGLVMRATKPIIVGRSNPTQDFKTIIKDGSELLNTGRSIVVFPQSTRSSELKPSEFNSIGIKLAKKANVPVVPMAIKTDFWGNGSILKDVGPLNRKQETFIEFGEPINIEGNGKVEHKKSVDFIELKLAEWNCK